ncbi:hypothetical protein CYY_006895 [Polysphondylium violaceum]|uniref:C2 domain-containing protein n=1 Tax=Polysphondylium violaceum TaxID=133409 RepID=A0A8J4UYE4_9MYCE|nr:hypothetical protein CYY_006895 [Polysphondylium violaceum]
MDFFLGQDIHCETNNNNNTTITNGQIVDEKSILSVTVLEAKDLKLRDSNNKIDSYVEIKYNEKSYNTKVSKNSVCPHWNENFELNITRNIRPQTISFSVWDREIIFKRNFIGEVLLHLDFIPLDDFFESWLHLLDTNNQIVGQLLVKARFKQPNDIEHGLDDWLVLEKSRFNPININNNNNNNNTASTTTTTTTTTSTISNHNSPNFNNHNNNFIYDDNYDDDDYNGQNFNSSLDPEILRQIASMDDGNDQDMLLHCILCKKNDVVDNLFLMDDCLHNFCRDCLNIGIKKQIANSNSNNNINCLVQDCPDKIHHIVIKSILGKTEYESFLNKTFEDAIENNSNFFKCPCCFVAYERIENANNNNEKNNRNQSYYLSPTNIVMNEEEAKHRDEYRFRCTKCSTEFCSDCHTTPYHYGFTCSKYKEYLVSRKCRFCSNQIKNNNNNNSKDGLSDVCESEECQTKKDSSCNKILKCGHNCIGIRNESKCEPCMDLQCYEKNKFKNSNEDYCNICYVESLKSAPCLKLKCGHIFHQGCVEKKIKEKNTSGPRLTFTFLDCPICKELMEHPSIQSIVEPILKLKTTIQAKALARLSYEGLSKTKELEDKKSKWFNNPDAYSMDRYVYYQCFKCKNPYFAGQARCDEGLNGDDYKQEDLICGNCRGTDGKQCKTHGWDYIIWKCQFCCSVAQWYCWGKTHFCTDCHTKQQKGDYLNRKPKTAIPMCSGIDQCPLKIEHPHCEEFILGCNLCKNLTEF